MMLSARWSVGGIFNQLPADERTELAALVAVRAAHETDPARRRFFEEFPNAFGLVDQEE